MVLRITNGFNSLADAGVLTKANNIMSGMTENINFPAPSPSLGNVQDGIDAFEGALSVAQRGSLYNKAVKNQKRAALIDLLHSLGNYVLFISNGNILVAKSSNFSIGKPPSPAPEVTAAVNQLLDDGENSGELIYSFDKVPGAKSYLYQYTAEPVSENSQWQSKTGTVKKVTFINLDKDKRYWCRVLAIGTNGQGVYSNPISRIAQ